ncbi:unnamed protein product [Haemonchus placei]|uniref:Delta-like protein n=1 Tax=Haemonchus placei TaxID=6290 RepID=A0A0N4X7G6_HAEPC|nr:unnamed protein product [Haemonchus placei]
MLPYPIKDPDRKCLKSGQLEIVGGTETVLDLIITNITVEYITVEFEIVGNTERPIQRISKRIAVDGGLPAERVAVAKGILIDFVTKCTRPFYGIMCARQCFEEDGAKYVCDPHGEKVCLVGWTGKDCNTGKCRLSLAFDVICLCLVGWTGKDCNTAMTGVSTEKLSSHAPILTSTSTSHKVDLSSHAPILTTTSSGRLLTKDIETTTRPKVLLVDPDVQKPSTPSPVATKQLPEKPVSAGPLSTGSTPVAHMTAVPTSTSRVTALPANSLIDHVLVLFFVAMLIGVIKYATWKMTRSVLLENWINQKRAKVFTTESSSHSLRKDVTEKVRAGYHS